MKDAKNKRCLEQAKVLFVDADNYIDEILMGYCRLMNNLFKNGLKDTGKKVSLYELMKACMGLEEREFNILSLKYGLNGDEPKTYVKIGEMYNLTGSAVGGISAKASRKLRHYTKAKKYIVNIEKTEMNVSELNLSVLSTICLQNSGVNTVKEFLNLSETDLLRIRRLSKNNVSEIIAKQKELLAKE